LIFSRVSKAFAIDRTLLTRRTIGYVNFALCCSGIFQLRGLTAGENHPDEVHEEIVEPKVKELWATVGNLLVIVIEHASGIVEDEAVNLSHANNNLKRMT